MSTPFTMAFAIAAVASVPRNSSTTKTPAISPFKKASDAQLLLPMKLEDTVLSSNSVDPVEVDTTPFTVNEDSLVDVV
jgi:hypothetical protein